MSNFYKEKDGLKHGLNITVNVTLCVCYILSQVYGNYSLMRIVNGYVERYYWANIPFH